MMVVGKQYMQKLLKHAYLGLMGVMTLTVLTACYPKPVTYDSQGNPIYWRQFKDKWVIINYWAGWCSPCLTEMPALQKLFQDYKNHILVLGINFDGASNQVIQSIRKKYQINYPMASSFPLKLLGVNDVAVLPTTFIINPQGKVAMVLKGPHTEQQLKNVIGLQ